MSCKKDLKACDPDALICRLNPNDLDPHFYDSDSGARRVFVNRYCSNFKKSEG